MPSGILGQSAPTALTNTTVYTVPSTKVAAFSVNILNRSGNTIFASLAIAGTGTPTNAEYIEFECPIVGNGVLERTGIVAQQGENVVVYINTADASVSVYGYEE